MSIAAHEKYVEITRADGSKLTIPRGREHELDEPTKKMEEPQMASPQQPPMQTQNSVTRDELQGIQDNMKQLTESMKAQGEAFSKMMELNAAMINATATPSQHKAMVEAIQARPERGMIKKIGSSMLDAVIAGGKMYGADTLIERQDQIYLGMAEWIASSRLTSRIPLIGPRMKRAEIRRFMDSIPVRVGKFTMNAVALMAVSESESIPDSIKIPMAKSLEGAMALQASFLAKKIGDPAVRAGFTFVASVSRFLSGSIGETIRAQIPASVSDNQ